MSKTDIKDIIDYQRGQTRQTRAEETAYSLGTLPLYQKAITDTALLMQQAGLQNRIAGEYARGNMAPSFAERSNVFQQGQALASGAFATELGAVSEAASRARRDVVAGLMAGRGRA